MKTQKEIAKAVGLKFCTDNGFSLCQQEIFLYYKEDFSYSQIGDMLTIVLTGKQVGKQVELMCIKINNRMPLGEKNIHTIIGIYKKAKSFNF